MTARAQWFIDLDDAEVATLVDLRDPDALRRELSVLYDREGLLSSRGVTCPIKEHKDSCCSACPVRHFSDGDPMTALCNVGREQERVLTSILAQCSNTSTSPAAAQSSVLAS